jgi:hypothetical protein
LLVFVLVSGEQTFTATFAIPNEGIEQMSRKNGGASANSKQIRTDVDCRAAQPRFDSGAWSPAKISDVTGGGLYLFVTPDESRPGTAASKLWRMGYRFQNRQKTYSIGPYGNGRDGTFSLADARRERDKAKDLLKDGKDPSTEKQLEKHRQTAARPFEQWADEWLAEKKVEKVKRGRIVAVRDPKTIEVLQLRVGYVKDRFGKLCRKNIKRPDVLAFMRSYEAEGKLETRDRVRSIGEQICDYADVEGDGYNPFRNLNGQMIANISTPRPGVTEPRDVTRVFKLISAINEVDVMLLHALSIGVGWPHRPKDWDFLRRAGHGIVAVDGIGRVFGSAMWFPHGREFAPIGLVITSPRTQAQALDDGSWSRSLNAVAIGI